MKERKKERKKKLTLSFCPFRVLKNVADKQTCHVTFAHWCVKDPRSGARARLPVSFFDAKKKETRKDDHGKGTRRVLFFSDPFFERIIIVSRRA